MAKQANEYSYPWLEEGEVPPLDRDKFTLSLSVADPVFDYDIVPLTYTESRWMAYVVEADEAALKAFTQSQLNFMITFLSSGTLFTETQC